MTGPPTSEQARLRAEAHGIDLKVSKRIALRRTAMRLSQQEIGAGLGLTFQQVQKYEKGTNRVSAGRLFQLAALLGIPINAFFDGLELPGAEPASDGNDVNDEIVWFARSAEGRELIAAYTATHDKSARKLAIEVLRLGRSPTTT